MKKWEMNTVNLLYKNEKIKKWKIVNLFIKMKMINTWCEKEKTGKYLS